MMYLTSEALCTCVQLSVHAAKVVCVTSVTIIDGDQLGAGQRKQRSLRYVECRFSSNWGSIGDIPPVVQDQVETNMEHQIVTGIPQLGYPNVDPKIL